MKIQIWIADLEPSQRHLAEALQGALASHADELDCDIVDVVAHMIKPAARTALRGGLSTLQSWLPQLWGFLYQQEELAQQVSMGASLASALDQERYNQHLAASDPTLVIALHPLAALPVVTHKRDHYIKDASATSPPLLAALVPHYHAHGSWLQPGICHYFTAAPNVAKDLAAGLLKTLPQAQQPTSSDLSETLCTSEGLPVPYEAPLEREALQEAFQLDPSQPAILLLGHHVPRDQLRTLLFQLTLVEAPIQWMIDYGDDADLATLLRELAQEVGLQARMFGGQADMQPFYTAADLVLARPEPSTATALLACDAPLLLWPPRPGPEQRDADALVQMGVAFQLASAEQASAQLEGLLASEGFTHMQNRVRQIQPPSVNDAIASKCSDLLARRDAILADEARHFADHYKATQRYHSDDAAPPRQEDEPPLSRANRLLQAFERIGETTTSAASDLGARLSGSHSQPGPITNPAAWKEAYTAVLVGEKQLQRLFEEIDEQISTWDERLDLAQRHQQDQLVGEAETHIKQLERRRSRLQIEWQQLQDEKQRLQDQKHIATSRNAASPRPDSPKDEPQDASAPASDRASSLPAPATPEPPQAKSFDKQFRELAIDDELERLKQKLRIDKQKLDISNLKDENE